MFPVQEPDTVNKPTSPKELTAKGVVAQMADEPRLLGDVRCSWVRSRISSRTNAGIRDHFECHRSDRKQCRDYFSQ